MFSRKPKNIISKVIDLTTKTNAKEASHTWMGEDKTRQARFGSTSRETFGQRRQIDRTRKVVSRYSDSLIGTSATRARGDITKATTQPPQPPSAPSAPDRSFYSEFRPKL